MKLLRPVMCATLMAAICFADSPLAQPETTGSDSSSEYQDKLRSIADSQLSEPGNPASEVDDPARPEQPAEFVEDPETREKYLAALKEYYDYRASGLQHRRAVFRWQLFSAKLIFATVLLIVGTGIVLAAIQFRVDLKRLDQGKSNSMPTTDIEASTKGIKVSSSIVGLIILALSLAFFYLYLVYVYPIEDIF